MHLRGPYNQWPKLRVSLGFNTTYTMTCRWFCVEREMCDVLLGAMGLKAAAGQVCLPREFLLCSYASRQQDMDTGAHPSEAERGEGNILLHGLKTEDGIPLPWAARRQ